MTSSTSGNTRSNTGTFSVETDDADTLGGAYLKYTQDGTKDEHMAYHLFAVNTTGAYLNNETDKANMIALENGKKYTIKIRYKINTPANQKWHFALMQTSNDTYSVENRDHGGTGVIIFQNDQPVESWTEEEYTFTAKSSSSTNNCSLLGEFLPVNSYGTVAPSSIPKVEYTACIDYITIKEYVAPPTVEPFNGNAKVEFDKYVVHGVASSSEHGTNRTDSGSFEIVEDATVGNGAYLKFTRADNDKNNKKFYMFVLNNYGAYTSAEKDKAITLDPAKEYKITVRYKIEGIEEGQKYQFRLYNSKAGTYSIYAPEKGQIVFGGTGEKSDWTIASGIVKLEAPSSAVDGNYGLVGYMAPDNAETIINDPTDLRNWSYSIDYVLIEEVPEVEPELPPEFSADHVKVDFDKFYDIRSDVTVREVFYPYCQVLTDATCEDEKYLEIHYTGDNTNVNNRVHHAFQINPTGSAEAGKVVQLTAGANYRLKIRYKVSDIAGDNKLYFVLYNSGGFKVKDWSVGGEKSLFMSKSIKNTNGWITQEYAFIAPRNNGGDYSLFGTFEPYNSTGSSYANIEYRACIDYIEITKVADEVSTTEKNIGDKVEYIYDDDFPHNYSKKLDFTYLSGKSEGEYVSQEVTGYKSTRSAHIYSAVVGDVDTDSVPCLLKDLVRLKKNTALVGSEDFTDGIKNLSDLNGDEQVDATDLSLLTKAILTGYQRNEEDIMLYVADPHPGIPGYDAEYELKAEWLNGNTNQIADSELVLTCNYDDVTITDNRITVPASLKDNTDLSDLVVTASYKTENGAKGSCSLPIVKWNNTFNDDFDGKTIDRAKWSSHNYIWHTEYDLKDGTTVGTEYQNDGSKNIRVDNKCYLENGNLVMPIVKNTSNESFTLNGKTYAPDYISAELRTDNTFTQNMGCFTVKMKGPKSNNENKGVNNAFWLVPKNGSSWGDILLFEFDDGEYKGCGCGEIDIVERSSAWADGRWNNTYHNFATDDHSYIAGYGKEYTDEKLLNGEYMEYTTAWMDDAIYTYANGKLLRAERNITTLNHEAYMILSNNLNSVSASNPSWVGYATDADLEDLTVYVDYVRAYSAE